MFVFLFTQSLLSQVFSSFNCICRESISVTFLLFGVREWHFCYFRYFYVSLLSITFSLTFCFSLCFRYYNYDTKWRLMQYTRSLTHAHTKNKKFQHRVHKNRHIIYLQQYFATIHCLSHQQSISKVRSLVHKSIYI